MSGPCARWPLSPLGLPATWDADPAQWTPAQQDAADMATEILWRLTAGVFGLCEVKLRPCRRRCEQWVHFGLTYGALYTPTVLLDQGRIYNVACPCAGPCGCSPLCELMLDPACYQMVEVKVDGQPLPTTAYRVDDGRRLVRVDGGCWPDCQQLDQPDTALGTWSVTYQYGSPVPTGGRVAVAVLAVELWKAMPGQTGCQLPQRVQQVVRDGVTYTLLDNLAVFEGGRTGLNQVDMWLASVNPHGARTTLRAYSPDTVRARHTTWPTEALPLPPDTGTTTTAEAYTYIQSTANAVWVITHDLGYEPGGVRVVDTTGAEIIGAVSYPSVNVVRVDFSYPVAGVAYLS